MVGVAYIIGSQGVYFTSYIGLGRWRRTLLEVVYNNHSLAPIYGGYLPRTGVYWCLLPTWCCQCLLQLVVCVATCVCIVVLGVHLVLCVGYVYELWCLEHAWCCQCLLNLVCVLAICIVGYLAYTLCKRGVALVKFQTFPISYGVMGHICILRDMYALACDKVNFW